MPDLLPPAKLNIFEVRGRPVMLDSDLASLYGVETKALLQQVRRNLARFPEDFMFQLSKEEAKNLRSHFVTSSSTHGGRRTLPYAFTEHGVAMLSSVLRSERAVALNIEIIRAFVAMRTEAVETQELARRLAELEKLTATKFGAHDRRLAEIFAALKALTSAVPKRKHPVGFRLRD
jgi:hypothetical protein